MKKIPLMQTKDQHGSKDKLVEAITSLLKRPANLTKDQLKLKLRAQSNKKLLILLNREQTLKEHFGSRDKLIDTIITSSSGKKKSEDKDYRKRLDSFTTGQLLDVARRKRILKRK
ncbi:MAG: hypothetical protein JRJ87_10175 [Deltaproteobacteria bacterium]|nr:hypothetical protein [Deltaproteobacteria bacterium]